MNDSKEKAVQNSSKNGLLECKGLGVMLRCTCSAGGDQGVTADKSALLQPLAKKAKKEKSLSEKAES